MARPRKPRAPKPIPPDKVSAAYASVGKRLPIPICPKCWSRPSVSKRVVRDAESTGKRGKNKDWWGLSVTKVTIGRQKVAGWEMWYPCSNDECNTHILVVGITSVDGEYLHPTIAKNMLGEADNQGYLHGVTQPNGVWRMATDAERSQMKSVMKYVTKLVPQLVKQPEPAPVPEAPKGRKPRSDKGKKRGPRKKVSGR
jgi:hypothetical protein